MGEWGTYGAEVQLPLKGTCIHDPQASPSPQKRGQSRPPTGLLSRLASELWTESGPGVGLHLCDMCPGLRDLCALSYLVRPALLAQGMVGTSRLRASPLPKGSLLTFPAASPPFRAQLGHLLRAEALLGHQLSTSQFCPPWVPFSGSCTCLAPFPCSGSQPLRIVQ